MILVNLILAGLRRIQTKLLVTGKQRFLTYGTDLHIGKGTRLWAPMRMSVGHHVYIGKHVHIEANCDIGDYCLLANHVAIVGRHDHDFTAVGYPVRYAPWISSKRLPSRFVNEKAVICSDVWLGYGAIVLTGVTIGRGAIVAAGSVVVNNIQPYAIVAGVPAKTVGQRFASQLDIDAHEAAVAGGNYSFSERGFDHCIIEPAYPQNHEQQHRAN
jgi:acetyltransferase-like isoleucine patch superfamily enzyme